MEMKSEAKLTTFEAISMIVGNSIGTGIIAVPYLATKNSLLDAKDDLDDARYTAEAAERNLFTAWRNYHWAVEKGILN